jgi:hypothetical protein
VSGTSTREPSAALANYVQKMKGCPAGQSLVEPVTREIDLDTRSYVLKESSTYKSVTDAEKAALYDLTRGSRYQDNLAP